MVTRIKPPAFSTEQLIELWGKWTLKLRPGVSQLINGSNFPGHNRLSVGSGTNKEGRATGIQIELISNFLSFSLWIFLLAPYFRSIAQSCPTLCNPMNRSTPGLPVHHQLLEFTQTHVHRVGDVIQPSHPLSSPSPPVPNPSQHQGLFQWINSIFGCKGYNQSDFGIDHLVMSM